MSSSERCFSRVESEKTTGSSNLYVLFLVPTSSFNLFYFASFVNFLFKFSLLVKASPLTSAAMSSSKMDTDGKDPPSTPPPSSSDASNKDNSFRQFRKLCEDIEREPSYNAKTKLVADFLKHGTSGGVLTYRLECSLLSVVEPYYLACPFPPPYSLHLSSPFLPSPPPHLLLAFILPSLYSPSLLLLSSFSPTLTTHLSPSFFLCKCPLLCPLLCPLPPSQ